MAFFEMPTKKEKILLEKARIIIELVNCRINCRATVNRCYKCFGYGHRQINCKEPDRKGLGLCIKCGEKEHFKKDFKNSPKCILSLDQKLNPESITHIPRSGSCRVFVTY